MIDEFNAQKSCLTKLKSYADVGGFSVAIDGKTIEFDSDQIYLSERLLSNDNSQGLSNSSSQIQLPIYQIEIHTPKIMGKWKGLEILNELSTHFERASDISLDASQQVFIEQVNKTRANPTETHNVTLASVDLRLIG